jgi:hypothetical protein
MSMIGIYRREGNLGIHELSGEKTYAEAKGTWETIRDSIRADHLDALLILDQTRSSLSAAEVVDIEQWFTEIGLPRFIKIAIVDGKTAAESDNMFGETVARNRGWPLITVFSSEAAARVWLGLGT